MIHSLRMNRDETLQHVDQLNTNDSPFEFSIDKNRITARWRWMDAKWFSPTSVTNEQRDYFFTVTLHDDNTWSESERRARRSLTVGLTGASFSKEISGFKGSSRNKSFKFGIGANEAPELSGPAGVAFDSNDIKAPLRHYLEQNGWKKRGVLRNIFSGR